MSTYGILGPLAFGLGVISIFIARKLRKSGGGEECLLSGEVNVLEVRVPRIDESRQDIQASSLAAESMFAALHGLLKEESDDQEYFSLEIISQGEDGIRFYLVVPKRISKFVESQVYAQYASAQIKIVDDYTDRLLTHTHYETTQLKLSREFFFPLKSFRDLEVDPLSGITSVMSNVGPEDFLGMQILVRPAPDVWQDEGIAYVEAIRDGVAYEKKQFGDEIKSIFFAIVSEVGEIIVELLTGFFRSAEESQARARSTGGGDEPVRLSPTQELEIQAVENKLSKLGYFVQVRLASAAADPGLAQSNMRSLIASLKQFYTTTTNSFTAAKTADKASILQGFRDRCFNPNEAFILNIEELAAVFHLPSSVIATPNMSSWVYSKKGEPPAELPTKDCTYIAETIYRDKKMRFGIKDGNDRLRHMYLIGKSGTGKSTMFVNMVTQDIAKGYGVGVLDPHGETIDTVLERIPDDRIEDVIYVDPSDLENPVGINLMELDDPSQKNLMASALVAAIKQHFDYSWGPRLEYLLNYSILTLLSAPDTTMLGITRLLEDPNYLKYILHYVDDPVVMKFWNTEYKNMKGNNKLVTEAIAPIQNKVNRFLASSTIRNILGQQKSTINFWNIMNEGKILLMNLSKGKIGADNANLLGALLVSRIQFMALQRAKLPPDERRPFYLYVDEFQNFATGSFESILSESRKYKLALHLTHQYTAQLPEELLQAVLGNVGTIASFALGAPDAFAMSKEFAPFFDENDLISMERFHIYIKLMINGMTSMPFSAKILLPWKDNLVPKSGNKESILQRSREKFGVSVEEVTREINNWTETEFDLGRAISERRKAGDVVDLSPEEEEVLEQDISNIEADAVYEGTIADVAGFGLFVEIKKGVTGLVHISEISEKYVKDIDGLAEAGEKVKVKVLEVSEDTGKIKLSMKGLNPEVDARIGDDSEAS
ncbi:S1 RNA-binding domain-containing protein [candidate division WWE3 bacterium]|nr:S1 RNA-binding domain-containing protein [candidate division WWE3 bacterium]